MLIVVLNAEVWFDEPLAARQLLSWIVLCLSALLAIIGFRMLRIVGRPEGDFENTTVLVTGGIYRFIRHPLYASLLLLAWGACLKRCGIVTMALALVATLALIATAMVEEKENVEKFGEKYRQYMERSKMFLPGIF